MTRACATGCCRSPWRAASTYWFNSPIAKVEQDGDGLCGHRRRATTRPIADTVLIATGRQPNTEGLGLDSAGVELDGGGGITVDEYSRTTCPSIYAVGDVTDRVQLTPVAIREGHAFADTVFGGKPTTVDYGAIPSAVFSQPPLAGVGLTESQARGQFRDIKVFTADFRPMKNMFADRAERGLYKLVVDAED